MRTGVFDTETTGLTLPSAAPLEKQPKIIEIGLVILEGSVVVEKYGLLIHPGEEITEEITKITGITNEDLAGQKSFAEAWPQIDAWFKSCDMLVAHNAPFDRAMFANEMARLGMTDWPWTEEVICSVQEFTHVFGYRPRLIDLYQKATGQDLAQTHRAVDDAEALAESLIKLGFFG